MVVISPIRLFYVSIAVAGLVWTEAAQALCVVVLLLMIFGRPKEIKNDTNQREPR